MIRGAQPELGTYGVLRAAVNEQLQVTLPGASFRFGFSVPSIVLPRL